MIKKYLVTVQTIFTHEVEVEISSAELEDWNGAPIAPGAEGEFIHEYVQSEMDYGNSIRIEEPRWEDLYAVDLQSVKEIS